MNSEARRQLDKMFPSTPREESCLSIWFPVLRESGVPVPDTSIVRLPESLDLWPLLDGDAVEGFDKFVEMIRVEADRIGYPCFLRTGQGSGKHEWKDTCLITDAACIGQHIYNLIEWSATVDFLGLPWDVWVIRRMIPTAPSFHAFGEMPITAERRYFINGGEVICHHPYWPEEAFESRAYKLPSNWKDLLAEVNYETVDEIALLTRQSEIVSERISGAWSLDWLRASDGTWYAIDMASAGNSWHPKSCNAILAAASSTAEKGEEE